MGVDLRGLERVLRVAVDGTVAFDAGTRALYATDASNYRHVPVGVVIPARTDDVIAAVAAARARDVPVSMRGGGTSVAGQATGRGLVIDTSRYLRRIEWIDPAARLARVQPGLVLDDLRAAAARHGLTFGPDPSTHNRCTIGGMIGNNACGAHSLAWGNTAENVQELDVLLYDGQRVTVAAGLDSTRAGPLRNGLEQFQRDHLALIRTGLPQLPRRCSGYQVDWLAPERGVQVARSLVGTEGTCAVVLGATVRLVEVPAVRVLAVLGYPDELSAADAAPAVVALGPLAVEGMERALIASVPARPPELPDGDGWLYAEFGGSSVAEATEAARRAATEAAALAYTIVTEPDRQRALWQLREHGVGWATRPRLPGGGEAEAWPGWEDAAVPPVRLGAYLREFKALLAEYGLSGSVYGHFGEGCVHVRINFDLFSTPGRSRFREFIEAATDLVVAHGGVPSGEHGDGQARAELNERVFGRPVVDMFAAFKAVWDPAGELNPGAAVRPGRLDADLRVAGPARVPRPAGLTLAADGGDLARATRRCVGVAACRIESGGVMCPSFRATHDDRHSTRGRARLLAEMLRGDLVADRWRSAEVRDALDLCLACKGCLSDCPVSVDMATYKAEFLHHHYRGRLRPRAHYTLGRLPQWLRLASRTPGLVNAVLASRIGARVVAAMAGSTPARPFPRIARTSFLGEYGPGEAAVVDVAGDHRVGGEGLGPDRLEQSTNGAGAQPPEGAQRQPVLVWPDTFTNYFTPSVGAAALAVLRSAGLAVRLPDRPVCCGLTYLSTGQLSLARRVLRGSLDIVESALDDGLPVLGLEPSCTAALRGDAVELLPDDPRAVRLAQSIRTLSELLTSYAPYWPERAAATADRSEDLPVEASDPAGSAGRKALVQRHCHQYAVLGFDADADVLRRAGIDADVLDGGCCGLAGNFGYEHYDVSMAIGELAVLPAVRAAPKDALVIADGFSCRLQIAHATSRRAIHLAEALAATLAPPA